jgi:hypothetical protein
MECELRKTLAVHQITKIHLAKNNYFAVRKSDFLLLSF